MDEDILARYNSAEGADDYLHKFERHWTERVNNWHEQRLIRHFSFGQESIPTVWRSICRAAMDVSIRSCASWEYPWWRAIELPLADNRAGDSCSPLCVEPAQNYVRANALALPFSGGAFEFVLSVRLSHHLPDMNNNLRHTRGSCHGAVNGSCLPSSDAGSVENQLATRNDLHGKRAKWTLTWRNHRWIGHAPRFRSHQMGVDFSLPPATTTSCLSRN